MHTIHIILYNWVYETFDPHAKLSQTICTVSDIMNAEIEDVPQFVQAYTAECHPNHVRDLMAKLSSVLRNRHVFGDLSMATAFVCSAFVTKDTRNQIYSRIRLPEGEGSHSKSHYQLRAATMLP